MEDDPSLVILLNNPRCFLGCRQALQGFLRRAGVAVVASGTDVDFGRGRKAADEADQQEGAAPRSGLIIRYSRGEKRSRP